jgi:hypothetical protein
MKYYRPENNPFVEREDKPKKNGYHSYVGDSGALANSILYIILCFVCLMFGCLGWVSWQTFWFVFFVRWAMNIERWFDKKIEDRDKNDRL